MAKTPAGISQDLNITIKGAQLTLTSAGVSSAGKQRFKSESKFPHVEGGKTFTVYQVTTVYEEGGEVKSVAPAKSKGVAQGADPVMKALESIMSRLASLETPKKA